MWWQPCACRIYFYFNTLELRHPQVQQCVLHCTGHNGDAKKKDLIWSDARLSISVSGKARLLPACQTGLSKGEAKTIWKHRYWRCSRLRTSLQKLLEEQIRFSGSSEAATEAIGSQPLLATQLKHMLHMCSVWLEEGDYQSIIISSTT